MSKLERLLNLTAALLETGRLLTAEEIQHRVPGYPDGRAAFRRSFERDKEDLREMGVPLELLPVPGTDPPVDGYRIPKRDYYLPEAGLEPDELAALHLAAAAVRLDGLQGVEGLWKLGGRPAGVEEAVPTGPGGGERLALPTDPNLVPLFTGVAERRVARFRYHDRERVVEPYRLDFRRGRWYLTAFDRDRMGGRNFRVDRIQGEIRLDDPGGFERPVSTAVIDTPPWEMGGGEPVVARLLVDAEQALWAVQHLGSDAVEQERSDGSMVFTVRVTNRPAFRSFVITFLDHAEILGPPELRAELVSWLEQVVA